MELLHHRLAEGQDLSRLLAALRPDLLITGHGRAGQGAAMNDALDVLARDFDRIAIHSKGKYRSAYDD